MIISMYYSLIDFKQMIIHFVEDNNASDKTFNCKENLILFLSLGKDTTIKTLRKIYTFCNMSSLRKDSTTKYGTDTTVDEIFDGIRTLSVIICFLLVTFLVIWIVYVLWKVTCRRSSVVDQTSNREYFEMDHTIPT